MQLSHLDYSTALPNTETYRTLYAARAGKVTVRLVAAIFRSFVSRAAESTRDIITDLAGTAVEVELTANIVNAKCT